MEWRFLKLERVKRKQCKLIISSREVPILRALSSPCPFCASKKPFPFRQPQTERVLIPAPLVHLHDLTSRF